MHVYVYAHASVPPRNSLFSRWVPRFVLNLALRYMGAKTPDEGTVSPCRLLFDDNLEGNGRYYGSDALRSPLDQARSPGDPEYRPAAEDDITARL